MTINNIIEKIFLQIRTKFQKKIFELLQSIKQIPDIDTLPLRIKVFSLQILIIYIYSYNIIYSIILLSLNKIRPF